MTVLVTGGTGFVGSNLVYHLADRGREVVCLGRSAEEEDDLRDWYLNDVAGNVHMVAGDVLEPDTIAAAVEKHGVDQVVHTATITPSREDERERSEFVLGVNVLGTSNVLDVARESDVDRVVYTSSGAVYRPNSELEPVDEYDPLDLNGLYPISKHTSEQLCTYYSDAYGLSTVSVRLGWIYGPMERPVSSRSGLSQVYHVVNHALDGTTVTINDPARCRDWTHARDVARGIRALLAAEDPLEPVYNLTCGRAYTGHEVIETVRDVVGAVDVEVVDDADDANVVVNSANRRGPLGIERVASEIGYSSRIDLAAGLQQYAEWLREAKEQDLL